MQRLLSRSQRHLQDTTMSAGWVGERAGPTCPGSALVAMVQLRRDRSGFIPGLCSVDRRSM